MLKSVKCPKCQSPVLVERVAPNEPFRCSACNSTFRFKAKSGGGSDSPDSGRGASDPSKSSDFRSAPTKNSTFARNRGARLGGRLGAIAGGIATLVIVIATMAVLKNRGDGKVGGDGARMETGDGPVTVIVDSVSPGPPATPPSDEEKQVATFLPLPMPPSDGRRAPPAATLPWRAQVDSSTKPAWDLPENWGLPLAGPTILASMGGPFVYEVAVQVESAPPQPAIDLRTGKPADGAFAHRMGLYVGGLLSPDGRYFVSQDLALENSVTLRAGELLVWRNDGKEPSIKIALARILLWHDFIADNLLAVALYDCDLENVPEKQGLQVVKPRTNYQVWDVSTGKRLIDKSLGPNDVAVSLAADHDEHEILADPQSTAPLTHRTWLYYAQRPVLGAVSPGGKYVVLGGRDHVTVLEAATGEPVGELPLAMVHGRRDFQGFGFSQDGGRLYGLVDFPPVVDPGVTEFDPHNVRLLSWSMADGIALADVPLADVALCGPLLTGPESGLLIAPARAEDAGGLREYSQFPLTIPGPGQVIATESGSPFLPLTGLRPLRWLSSGRLLASGPMTNASQVPADPTKPLGLLALDFSPKNLPALAKENYDAAGPRPPVMEANRSGIAVSRPTPPAEWSVPKTPALPPVGCELPSWPAAFGDRHAAIVDLELALEPTSRFAAIWRRFDLADGRDLGAVLLWPWTVPATGGWQKRAFWQRRRDVLVVAALTADGKSLALRDPADATRVDVWRDDGQRVVGFRPYGESPVEWLGFAADGKLLTQGEGKLTGWDVTKATPVFEVDGGYRGAAQLAPGRAWLAATHDETVDFLDTADGRCLGRVTDAAYRNGLGQTAPISPDGRTLVRVGLEKNIPHGVSDTDRYLAARVWDLETGQPKATIRISIDRGPLRGVFWRGPRQFLANDTLYDLDAASAVCGYRYPKEFARPVGHTDTGTLNGFTDVDLTRATPQGQVFVNTTTTWKPLPPPSEGPDAPLSGAPAYAYHSEIPLQIEVHCKSKEAGQALAESMAAILRDRGAVVGSGGWTLKLTYRIVDSQDTSKQFTGALAGLKLPEMDYSWTMVSPKGAVAWQKSDRVSWGFMGSKYSGRTNQVGPAFGPNQANFQETELDFKGRDPRTAIEEELEEQLASLAAAFPPPLPRAILDQNGTLVPMPLAAEYKTP